jgi:DNA-binding response OmpR family regulator
MPESGQPRILVVDDNRLVLEMIQDGFRDAGFEVTTAQNGALALESARADLPDAIVSDILMPTMDGWELFRAVREDPELREVPFLFLTSEREASKRVEGLRMGAEDYVTKPFVVEELVLRVRLIIERQGGRGKESEVPRESVLAGHTSHLPIADLLQLLSSNGKTGVLRLLAEQPGQIVFKEGRVVQAEVPGATGRKALYRLVGWGDARFAFDPEGGVEVVEEIAGSTAEVVMDALVELDELERLRGEAPPFESVFRVRRESRERVRSEGLSKTEFEIVRAAKEGIALSEMVNRSRATDTEVLRTVIDLLSRGVLEPAEEPGTGGGPGSEA